MIGSKDVINAHDAAVLMTVLGADVEYDHRQVVVEVAEAQLRPDVLLSCVLRSLPSMGLTSNSWHISFNFSLNLGSDLI
jgi:hypothetical protein